MKKQELEVIRDARIAFRALLDRLEDKKPAEFVRGAISGWRDVADEINKAISRRS